MAEEEAPAFVSVALSAEDVANRKGLVETHFAKVDSAKLKHLVKKEREETYVEELADKKGEMVFGELSFDNVATIINDAFHNENVDIALKENAIFVDCGSGIGRCVMSASVLHCWAKCHGIEALGCLDAEAQEIAGSFKEAQGEFAEGVHKSEVSFEKGDMTSAVAGHCGEDQLVALAVATCFSDQTMKDLTASLAKAPVDSCFITVTKPCPDIDLWEPMHIEDMSTSWSDRPVTLFINKKIAMPPEE